MLKVIYQFLVTWQPVYDHATSIMQKIKKIKTAPINLSVHVQLLQGITGCQCSSLYTQTSKQLTLWTGKLLWTKHLNTQTFNIFLSTVWLPENLPHKINKYKYIMIIHRTVWYHMVAVLLLVLYVERGCDYWKGCG